MYICMSKFFRGDLLILTNKGLKRIDKIEKTDLILSIKDNKPIFEEIDEIEKKYIKKYKLNKIKLLNSIDNYHLNDNVKIKALQNIPANIQFNEIPNYLSENMHKCLTTTTINNLTDFDYIGFPICENYNSLNMSFDNENNDYYRFQGLLLLNYDSYILNNANNEKTIGFLTKYLLNNDIKYEITTDDKQTIIKFDRNIVKKIVLEDILKLNNSNLFSLFKGLTEITKQITTNDKNLYFIIKYVALVFRVLISSNFINDKIIIKIPEFDDTKYNYFIYDNYIWNKIKYIKKIEVLKCNLYSLTLKNNAEILTDVGIIS
jgi:hypothetical protein